MNFPKSQSETDDRVLESGEDLSETVFSKRGCCSWIPFFGSNKLETVGLVSRNYHHRTVSDSDDKWWKKGINALKKVREWSEIVAGPKWKTFIRRFNRKGRGGGGNNRSAGQFQYDPLSYALNFDEGNGGGGQTSLLDDDDFAYRDFSSRFAALPVSVKPSMDSGRDGPSFI